MMEKIAYIEFCVRDIQQSLQFYRQIFQFTCIAEYSDLSKYSLVLKHNNIYLILSTPQYHRDDIAIFLATHGEGVMNIAFFTNDLKKHYFNAISNGAESISKPTLYSQNDIEFLQAKLKIAGDITHTYIQCDSPEFFMCSISQLVNNSFEKENFLLDEIDHLAICVPKGELFSWVEAYKKIFGFFESHHEYVITPKGGMNSFVLESQTGNIKLVFLEPTDNFYFSHLNEFLSNFGGAGVQHIAFRTGNIINTVTRLKANGLEFLSIPKEYYMLKKEMQRENNHSLSTLAEHSILIDNDEKGVLYQTFSKSIFPKPTLFFEIIERNSFSGFGTDNINMLYKAAELEKNKTEV